MPQPSSIGDNDTVLPTVITCGAGVVALGGGVIWVAGGLASLVSGHGWRSAPFTFPALIGLLRHGPAAYWPGVDRGLVAGIAVALGLVVLTVVVTALVAWAKTRPGNGDPRRSLARQRDVAPMLPLAAARRAKHLRPSLAESKPKDIAAGDAGMTLGRLANGGEKLLSSWEDVVLAIMAPRSGKTTSIAVPAILDAPGAVLLTSNKPDGWRETVALRATATMQTSWTFDPQRIVGVEQTWWWNPLAGLRTVEEANRLAGHFISTVEGEQRGDVWGPAAKELLGNLLLAAALSGKSVVDVYRWLTDQATPVPRGILAADGQALLADSLRNTQDLPPETRGGVYFTAQAACQCLRDEQITAWVTPPQGVRLPEFDAEAFPTTRQTLYLLSKDGGGSAGPLVAALADRVMRAGVKAAEQRGGRLDPPMVAVLDEAANVCRIADLPDLYSHLGSRGVIPVTILQSYSQAKRVWGEGGAAALWSAATVKLIGAGIDDASFAEDISRLVGEHEVTTVSRSAGGSKGAGSRTYSTRTQRILTAAQIRAMRKGSALLLATGMRPALLALMPWHEGPRKEEIAAAALRSTQDITARAQARSAA
ncbi:type IV secretory system conjugative DNA transfer family protein [Enterococcus hirae]|uniref:type IV secretory system conjugative DNA transfer family protein n=1 Tax=Enterococcus hirae TaxID=1354 RepID=UPI00136B2D3B|nr:TraM recognition domain-containing protein [Enterococcus hirae]NAE18021.1 TraM recognition domain-containing protein [Enterococcus hirae]